MKRSRIFITVLLSLFMFQSIWNVAAAFCVHESDVNRVTTSHFGHHSNKSSHEQHQSDNQKTSKFIQYLEQVENDDHSDHLPSLAHAFLVEHSSEINWNVSTYYIEDKFLDWSSLYQSPHLYLPKLPPIYTPL
ncbi:cation efflux protein, CzcI-like [Acinetobacter portensis]|uniref:cation efflux protein, CzcI-like n=1 Tax=Acinetobacter portensis TaxID=1839785 RepID=UPI0013D16CA4|nr:cation efflux protein, CzcI-like [Acinetobacter portensis]